LHKINSLNKLKKCAIHCISITYKIVAYATIVETTDFWPFPPYPAKNPTKTPRQKSAKNPTKTPATKICQKSWVHDYTILRPFYIPLYIFFFRFFLQTPSRIEKNREIASPR